MAAGHTQTCTPDNAVKSTGRTSRYGAATVGAASQAVAFRFRCSVVELGDAVRLRCRTAAQRTPSPRRRRRRGRRTREGALTRWPAIRVKPGTPPKRWPRASARPRWPVDAKAPSKKSANVFLQRLTRWPGLPPARRSHARSDNSCNSDNSDNSVDSVDSDRNGSNRTAAQPPPANYAVASSRGLPQLPPQPSAATP